MKSFLFISLCVLLAACASRKQIKRIPSAAVVPGTSVSLAGMPEVRTSETVKAYPVGRYTDPNFPDEMHERHTLYRREQSPDWNYRPSKPYDVPLAPAVASSNPSPNYYFKADTEQSRACTEALREQNASLQKRIGELQKNEAKVKELQKQVEDLKQSKDNSSSESPFVSPSKSSAAPLGKDDFSFLDTEAPPEFIDPSDIVLFPDEDNAQEFLLSQMLINDALTKQLEALESRREVVFFASLHFSKTLNASNP